MIRALLILSCAAAVFAVELPTRTIDEFGRIPITQETGTYAVSAYVDAGYYLVDPQPAALGRNGTGNVIQGFDTTLEAEGMYRASPEVLVVGAVRATTIKQDQAVELTEAYIRLDREDWYARMGRTHQWFGWERFSSPELWRVNRTYTYYNSGDLDGATIGVRLPAGWRAEVSTADEIITPRTPSLGKSGTDLGYGAKLRWTGDHGQTWDLTGYIDRNTAPSYEGGYGNVSTLSSWGELRRLAGSELSVAYDAAFSANPDGNQRFLLVAARADGALVGDQIEIPVAATVMLTYLEEQYRPGAINAAAAAGSTLFDNRRLEYALALFAWPFGDRRYRLGLEGRVIDSSVINEDEYGVYLQAVAILP